MKVKKNNYVSVNDQCIIRLIKNGVKTVNNKFKVSKGTNREDGFVELETIPHKMFVSAEEIVYVWDD